METPRILSLFHTFLSLSLINGPSQLDQNLCLKKEKQKRKKEREVRQIDRQIRLDVFKCPPTKLNITTSLILSHKICSPNYPSARPQKNPIFITLVFQNKNIFHRVMWAFWVSFSWSEFHREKQENREPFLPHLPHPLLSLFIHFVPLFPPIPSLSLFLSFSLFITSPSSFSLSSSFLLPLILL